MENNVELANVRSIRIFKSIKELVDDSIEFSDLNFQNIKTVFFLFFFLNLMILIALIFNFAYAYANDKRDISLKRFIYSLKKSDRSIKKRNLITTLNELNRL